jgi:hypothetical protein
MAELVAKQEEPGGKCPYKVADISVKLLLRKLDRYSTSIWQISAQQNQGIPFFTATYAAVTQRVECVHRAL